jgi:hypothetical protein
VQSPSTASVKQIERWRQQLSLLDRRLFADVAIVMHSSQIDKHFLDLGQEFIRMVNLMDERDASGEPLAVGIRNGLFRADYAVKRSELLYTSVLASKLGKLVPRLVDREAHWLHQIPERSDGKMDICLYLEEGGSTWAPVCFFEFGLNCASRQKYNQAIAYGVNLSPQLLPDHLALDVEIILSATDHADELGWMHLCGFRLVEGRKVGFANIWQGPLTAHSVSRLLSAIELVARSNFSPLGHRPWQQVKNSCLEEDFVWKVFDYRERKVPEAERRSPEYSLKFIPNCEKVVEAGDLTLIRYPRIQGSHTPKTICQWMSVIESVLCFHAANVVHGDLRASNIIFHDDKEGATIIDFDLAGENGRKIYPKGFNTKINDGARAPRSVSEGRPLLFEHDWFAIGAMMNACVLEDCEQQDWLEACRLLEEANVSKETVGKVLGLLEKCKDARISGFKFVSEENPGTGSPERNPEKK